MDKTVTESDSATTKGVPLEKKKEALDKLIKLRSELNAGTYITVVR
jgi:hypothetical protein